MERLDDFYWPDGLPEGSSHPEYKEGYADQEGKLFYICYTTEQRKANMMRYWGFFMPYVPLMWL